MSSASKSEIGSAQPDTANEQSDADYLQAHPDFFERHQTL